MQSITLVRGNFDHMSSIIALQLDLNLSSVICFDSTDICQWKNSAFKTYINLLNGCYFSPVSDKIFYVDIEVKGTWNKTEILRY